MRYHRCLLIGLSLLFACGTSRAGLQVVAHLNGRTIRVTGQEDNRIVGEEDGHKVLLTRDTTYTLEGDLAAEADKVVWSPPYSIGVGAEVDQATRPGVFAVGHVSMVHWTEMDGKKLTSPFLETWPDATATEGGLMVIGWLVDGKFSQLAVKKVPAAKSAGFFVISHDFNLTPAETKGQGVLLLWIQGRFITPRPRFADARVQRSLAAMLLGNNEPLRQALADGMKPAAKGYAGYTLLHFAAEAGAGEAMDLLHQAGAGANARSDTNTTPLFWAAQKGRLGAVNWLLDHKVSVDTKNNHNETPLLVAVKSGHLDVARILIEKGAGVNAANDEYATPYSLAIDSGYADLATRMLARGADRKYSREVLQRVLLSQAAKGNTAMVQFLLGQKIGARFKFEGRQPLGEAAKAGDSELVQVLLAAGADLNDPDADGLTPLMLACDHSPLGFIQTLLDAGADLKLRAKDGRTCLHYAARRNLPGLVELLVAKGAEVAAIDHEQSSPLDLALLTGAQAAARELGAHGAIINRQSPRAAQLLEAAVVMDVAGPVKAALAGGWPADTRFADGWPALFVARASRAGECAAALEQAGADPAPADAENFLLSGKVDARPQLQAMATPVDPRDPDAEFPASLVEVGVIIDRQGQVRFPLIKTAPDWRVGYAALQAISVWRFNPLTSGGKPTGVRLNIPVEFPASKDLIFRAEQADVLPVPLKRAVPEFPGELSHAGQSGRVMMVFTVGKDGRVSKVRALSYTDLGFIKPAMDAIAKWIFRPGLIDGQPVDIRMQQEMVFGLQ